MKSNQLFASLHIRALALFGLITMAATVQAHPGHSLGDESWSHLFTSPDHLLMLGGMGAVLLMLAKAVTNAKAQRALKFSGISMIVIAAAVWGITA